MRDDIRAKISSNIQQYRQHVVCVGRSQNDPADFLPFVYTIGNYEIGFPELLLIGESGDLYVRILNIVGDLQRERGSALKHGELVDFTARLPARIIDAGEKGRAEYAIQVGVYYRTDDFEVRQILLPDQNGCYPDEAGCLAPYSDQPILTATH